MHSVAVVVFGGAVTARCRTNWSERLAIESHDDPPIGRCCAACVRELVRVDGCDVAWTGLGTMGGA